MKIVEQDQRPKRIGNIRFGLLSDVDMMKMSHVQVVNRELYQMPKRTPMPNGCLDPKLGVSSKNALCGTCGQKTLDCVGHFGYIKLELPVFHIGYIRNIITILQMICKTCSRILLPIDSYLTYLQKARRRSDALHKKHQLERVTKQCKKVKECPYCKAVNGTVKKVAALKLIHERYKIGKNEDLEFQASFEEAVKFNNELKAHLGKAQEDLNPIRVLNLFKKIPDQDVEILNMDPKDGRPERLLLTALLVPPVAIRPSVNMDTQGSNEDDLTIKLSEIVHFNEHIQILVSKGAPMHSIMEDWDYMQLLCAIYINSELPGVPPSLKPSKAIRGLSQRLKGKAGRFRGNLSGKRVDFSGRTVISPDPNLGIDEVGVPDLIAKVMTYPERVNDYNLIRMQQYILNGPERHPGANYVNHASGEKINLQYANREKVAGELVVGDVVERHIINGDVLLFNRQPSLHKLSIMAHKARVMPWRTLRFNECVCTPYNADFDGDEMNIHLPQTEEARTEALVLMGVVNNLITPRNGEPLVAATQDFLTGGYLLTKRDAFFDRAQFTQMCTFMSDGMERIDLPPPAILKPIELWTGKQIFSVLIRPNHKSHVLVNLETASKNYSWGGDRGKGKIPYLCPNDGWIYFRNSDLVCGTLDKSILGSGTKNSLFHALLRDFSPEIAANCMSRLAKLCARWLGDQGFSIGIPDVRPSAALTERKLAMVKAGYKMCDGFQESYKTGKLLASPGCSVEATLESSISGELNAIRENAGKMCMAELHPLNSPLIMSLCGSKGSVINIAQMIACVGQQIVNGKRIPNGFSNRTLPHFEVGAKGPAAKGFVSNSFFTGLTATEFFFHTMGGREGLVDTAVKTAETGYMQRRLMKALEDLSTQYDYTVRNSYGGIVQFIYGDDGLDPAGMEAKDRPVEIPRLLMSVKAQSPSRKEPALLPYEIKAFIEKQLAEENFKECSEMFKDEIKTYFGVDKPEPKSYIGELIRIRRLFGLPTMEHKPTSNVHVEPAPANLNPNTKSELTPEQLRNQMTAMVNNLHRLSHTQLLKFLEICARKYQRAKIEPGTAVGALGAQSIGEPGTQMTLKTFHFAGVASMNVTLGVPRIKEIINASKKISTPIISAYLECNTDKKSAMLVKSRIERTTLGDVAMHIKEVYTATTCYLSIKLDRSIIDALQLDITSKTVVAAIIAQKKLKLKEDHVKSEGQYKVRITPKEESRQTLLYKLQYLKNHLSTIIVKGIPTIERVVLTTTKDNTENYLVVEGMNLLSVMATPGIKSTTTISNHVAEVEKHLTCVLLFLYKSLQCCLTRQIYLGIEAARSKIMSEIAFTMISYGMSIDSRHMMLLADVMTYKGETLGITRFGIAKMKESVLMLASFEKTSDHLFDASVHARVDKIVGVSECIIMGIPVPLGTGLFKIVHKYPF